MSSLGKVGDWIKNNAGSGTALVGSLLTGNATGEPAAGISLPIALVLNGVGVHDNFVHVDMSKSFPVLWCY